MRARRQSKAVHTITLLLSAAAFFILLFLLIFCLGEEKIPGSSQILKWLKSL